MASAAEPAALDRETKPSAPATDALNLWVLNRPKGDLPTNSEPAPVPAEPAGARRTALAVVVVLGVGPGQACAERLCQQAVGELSAARAPLDVMASLLDTARRWRWAEAASTSSAVLEGSGGEFGGVQSAPPSAFSPALLRRALGRRAILGGPRPPWPAASSEPSPELPACDASPDPALAGPIGVLMRSRDGQFFGGVLSADPPADAGVVSIAAQHGVSLAVGAAGGVLMIGDCDPPPLERVAERVYASANWMLATVELPTPGGCRLGHALLTAERAWAAPESALAWAVAEAAPATTPPAAAAAAAPDAGTAAPVVKP